MRPADVRKAEAAQAVKDFDRQAAELTTERWQRPPHLIADAKREVPLPFETPTLGPPDATVICGDVIDTLRTLPEGMVSAAITSPPYYGLRSYNIPPRSWTDGTTCVLGDEATVEVYIEHLVEVMREVRRVLHPRGTLWLNLGDSYAGGGRHDEPKIYKGSLGQKPTRPRQRRLTSKDLLMVPARAALALQADGWILRQDNIWAKGVSFLPSFSGSVMPESTRDRTTWSHEHVFQLAKQTDYFYDQDAYREPFAASSQREAAEGYKGKGRKDYAGAGAQNPSDVKRRVLEAIKNGLGRNLRNVWVIPKQAFPGAHFATFSQSLVAPIVALSASEGGVCGVCAAPQTRKVTKTPVPAEVQRQFEASRVASAAATGRTDGHTTRRPNFLREVLAVEWLPSCSCGRDIVPATVLDPFSGSGQTGIAAVKQGRSYIGIDVNPEYVAMSVKAIEEVRHLEVKDEGQTAKL